MIYILKKYDKLFIILTLFFTWIFCIISFSIKQKYFENHFPPTDKEIIIQKSTVCQTSGIYNYPIVLNKNSLIGFQDEKSKTEIPFSRWEKKENKLLFYSSEYPGTLIFNYDGKFWSSYYLLKTRTLPYYFRLVQRDYESSF